MLWRLAWTNLARRPTRALLLLVAVAVSSSALLATSVLLAGLDGSFERGLARLGADLGVLSREALVNPTASLLTGEAGQPPLSPELVERVVGLPGVALAAPQRVLSLSNPDFCGQSSSELVAFDPARDFTVLPWVEPGHLERPFAAGDLIAGCRHPYQPGEHVALGGVELTVWGRLSPSGVGPHERGLFVTFATATRLEGSLARGQSQPGQPSVLLLRLADGFSPESVRFSLAALSELRVLEGGAVMTGVRQSVLLLLQVLLVLAGLTLTVTALMIGVVFSAVLGERKAELGVLLAVGMSPARLVSLVSLEAALATGLGGLAGLGLGLFWLRLAAHTLLARLEALGVPFAWPGGPTLATLAVATLLISLLVGWLGALYPAWRLGRREPYELMRGEG